MPVPEDAHEWLSFEDPDEDRTWLFDVTFLASSWRCIYGDGCQGVLTAPSSELAEGCCSYGAHFSGPEDVERVLAAAERLGPEQFQFRVRARRGGITRNEGDATLSRLADDACIFLNRPGFPGGAGCALHRGALEAGEAPMDWKPDVCWQLPLRRVDTTDDAGHVTSRVSQWRRRDWGEAGDEFAWWCTEAPEAFSSPEPVFVHLRAELDALVGASVAASVVAYLESRRSLAVALAHPVVRTRTGLLS